MKRIGVLTSGGDAPGMNAAIRAVVRAGLSRNISTVGFKRGYNGILMQNPVGSEDYSILTSRDVSGIVHRGGTFLRTARCLEFLKPEYQKKAIENMASLGIEGLVCIGGDGTYRGAAALKSLGFPVIGIPGTIDNDLEYTDYTIGFDTALNTAIESIDRIRDTSGSHERASFVTVMGRNCGDIALHTALACGAEIVMIPETPWSMEDVADQIKWAGLNGKSSVIMVFAEGALKSLTSDVEAICASDQRLEGIYAKTLSSSEIAKILEVLSGHEVRATVLGYTQRGGNPSGRDRILAERMGAYAVELLAEGICGDAVGVKGDNLIHIPIEEALTRNDNEEQNQAIEHLIKVLSGFEKA